MCRIDQHKNKCAWLSKIIRDRKHFKRKFLASSERMARIEVCLFDGPN